MAGSGEFYKENPTDKVWRVDTSESDGEFLFSFDGKTTFNLFRDYPWKLTPEEKAIFDAEYPFWKEFFADRR